MSESDENVGIIMLGFGSSRMETWNQRRLFLMEQRMDVLKLHCPYFDVPIPSANRTNKCDDESAEATYDA